MNEIVDQEIVEQEREQPESPALCVEEGVLSLDEKVEILMGQGMSYKKALKAVGGNPKENKLKEREDSSSLIPRVINIEYPEEPEKEKKKVMILIGDPDEIKAILSLTGGGAL